MTTRLKAGTTLRAPDGDLALVLGYTARFALLLVPGGGDRYAPLARYDAVAMTPGDLHHYVPVVGETFRPAGAGREEAFRAIARCANNRHETAGHELDLGRRAQAAEHTEIGRGLWDVVHRCRAAAQDRRAA
jgi:hypothetical protein